MHNILVHFQLLCLLSLAFIILLVATSCAQAAPATVKVITLREGCLAPDVAVDANGVLHVVVGLKNDAYYLRSTDNGATFSRPVKLNNEIGVTTAMGERGPKIALGKDGAIFVCWADRWSPGVKVYARLTRSLDGGKTFNPPIAMSDVSGFDGLTLTADTTGNVLSFWHINDARKPLEKQATWLYMTRSTDNGLTFSKSERLYITGHNGLACSMCMMRARMTTDGRACLVFRSATGDVRDFYVLTGKVAENDFTAVRVNTDNWKIDYCPMCGPELTLAPDGRAYCAFMTSHKVYWAVSNANITTFNLHVGTRANENDEIYPTAIANRQGDVLFLWQVGPMSVSGTAVVKWERYTTDGKTTGERGTVGTSFSGTKATAFVGADGNFYIVTTAK